MKTYSSFKLIPDFCLKHIYYFFTFFDSANAVLFIPRFGIISQNNIIKIFMFTFGRLSNFGAHRTNS